MPWPQGAWRFQALEASQSPSNMNVPAVLWFHASQAWISGSEILPYTSQSIKVQLRIFILCNSCKKEKKYMLLKNNKMWWVCEFFLWVLNTDIYVFCSSTLEEPIRVEKQQKLKGIYKEYIIIYSIYYIYVLFGGSWRCDLPVRTEAESRNDWQIWVSSAMVVPQSSTPSSDSCPANTVGRIII